jgi:hypothetical protein
MPLRARGGLKVEWVLLVSVCVFTIMAHIRLSSRPPHRHQQLDLCAAREAEARRAGADAAVKHIRSQSIVRDNLPSPPTLAVTTSCSGLKDVGLD